MWPYDATYTADIVRRIARTTFGERPITEPVFLAKGSNNEVFSVEFLEKRYVIRVTGEWRERTTHRETWCYHLARKVGIPGPDPIAVGKMEKLPYIVLTYIEGVTGTDFDGDKLELWHALGRYGRLINSIYVGDDGSLVGALTLYDDPIVDFKAQLRTATDALNDPKMTDLVGIDAGLQRKIRSVIVGLQAAHYTTALSHGDLDPRNLIVDRWGTPYLIDYCCSQLSLVPHVDLFNILRETSADGPEIEAYLSGYEMSRQEFERLLPEVRAYGLVQRLKRLQWSLAERMDLVEEDVAALQRQVEGFMAYF